MTYMLAGLAVFGCFGSSPVEENSPGARVFRTNCQTCHSLPRPALKTDSEWPPLVARYGQRASLSDEQISSIVDYLIAAN
jgi:cytochrome c5